LQLPQRVEGHAPRREDHQHGDAQRDGAVIVVPVLPAVVCTTSVKAAVALETSVARLQLTVPPAPTAGVVQINAGPFVPSGAGRRSPRAAMSAGD
jgi:hypothetical protein